MDLGMDSDAFMDAIRDFVMAAVAFRDAEITGAVGDDAVQPIASVRGLAEEPGMFADLLAAADSVVEIATRNGLLAEGDN
jgi:hypothetical protein